MKKLISIIKDKERLHRILFEGTDPLSKPVDITIMIAIALCIVMASLDPSGVERGWYSQSVNYCP